VAAEGLPWTVHRKWTAVAEGDAVRRAVSPTTRVLSGPRSTVRGAPRKAQSDWKREVK
jgi:hypothetical protein